MNPVPLRCPRTSHWSWLHVATGCLFAGLAVAARGAAGLAAEGEPAAFIDRYCSGCHNDVDREGGLDLTSLAPPRGGENLLTWIKVHDRVQDGEMPPREKKRPPAGDIARFVGG